MTLWQWGLFSEDSDRRASILARQTMVMPLSLGRFMSSLAQVRLGPSKPILKPQIQKRMTRFGFSVSVDGDTLAVGAFYEANRRHGRQSYHGRQW